MYHFAIPINLIGKGTDKCFNETTENSRTGLGVYEFFIYEKIWNHKP